VNGRKEQLVNEARGGDAPSFDEKREKNSGGEEKGLGGRKNYERKLHQGGKWKSWIGKEN